MSLQEKFLELESHLKRLVVGQERLLNRMLVVLLCDGHLLVEGAPGLAKTRAIKVLSHSIEGDFHRLQFTPDLCRPISRAPRSTGRRTARSCFARARSSTTSCSPTR